MKILLAALSLSIFSLGASCQQTTPVKKAVTTPPRAVGAYRCPVCGVSKAAPGECPKDKTTLVKVGDYYCPDCYMSSKKPGKCEMCGVDMKQMQASAK